MLQRMLGSHSAILTHPEPHILTPLAFQGYFYEVDKAKYNHKVAAQAFREFVDFLPHKEEDYLHACREYCNVLYSSALEGSGRSYFLDKTPNYADTILPFVLKLLPEAKVIVLTRHPLAVVSSHANTFDGGNYDLMYFNRDIIGDFIPAIAELLRDTGHHFLSIKYEDLVSSPDFHMARIFEYLGLEHEDSCVDFGKHNHINKTYGDPKIGNHDRPVADSINNWVNDLKGRPDRIRLCKLMLSKVTDDDLEVYGYSRRDLWRPLDAQLTANPPVPISLLHSFKFRLVATAWGLFRLLQTQAQKPKVRRVINSIAKLCDALAK
jgi:hypothetical protein